MAAGAVLAALTASAACSSSSVRPGGVGSSCSADPTICQAGTTCWPADTVPHLECLPSTAGAGFGATCQQSVGQATCGDGLACDQVGATAGSCTSYCSATIACQAGYSCRMTTVGTGSAAPSIDICRPTGLMVDSGVPVPPEDANFDALFVPDAANDGSPMKQ